MAYSKFVIFIRIIIALRFFCIYYLCYIVDIGITFPGWEIPNLRTLEAVIFTNFRRLTEIVNFIYIWLGTSGTV